MPTFFRSIGATLTYYVKFCQVYNLQTLMRLQEFYCIVPTFVKLASHLSHSAVTINDSPTKNSSSLKYFCLQP